MTAPTDADLAALRKWTVARHMPTLDALIAERDRLRARVAEVGAPCPPTCCSPSFVHRGHDGQPDRWAITLNEYQRANLLWLLCDIAGYDRATPTPVPGLQTGDWCGEIANALRINESGEYEESKYKPNVSVEQWRAWNTPAALSPAAPQSTGERAGVCATCAWGSDKRCLTHGGLPIREDGRCADGQGTGKSPR